MVSGKLKFESGKYLVISGKGGFTFGGFSKQGDGCLSLVLVLVYSLSITFSSY